MIFDFIVALIDWGIVDSLFSDFRFSSYLFSFNIDSFSGRFSSFDIFDSLDIAVNSSLFWMNSKFTYWRVVVAVGSLTIGITTDMRIGIDSGVVGIFVVS